MFEGQSWWITGASSGIGAALARELAGRGASLILSGRREDALAAVAADAKALGAPSLILPFEATDLAALPGVTAAAWGWRGRVDGLVNNAGLSQRSLAVDTDWGVYDRIIDTDLKAPIALTQHNLPRMVAAGGGRIVGVSSVAGLAGVPLRTAYCAAKHGLVGYLDALRAEVAHQGIEVLVVCPGAVATDVSRNALNAGGERRGESDSVIDSGLDPADVARDIADALAAGTRELILTKGPEESGLAALRRADPDAAFDRMEALVASGYAEKLGAKS